MNPVLHSTSNQLATDPPHNEVFFLMTHDRELARVPASQHRRPRLSLQTDTVRRPGLLMQSAQFVCVCVCVRRRVAKRESSDQMAAFSVQGVKSAGGSGDR